MTTAATRPQAANGALTHRPRSAQPPLNGAAASSPAPPAGAVAAALTALCQCADFLQRLSDAAYTTPSRSLSGSTIGQHVRHTLDHFLAALAGAQGRVIDYDHRRRETPVERDRSAASQAIAGASASLARLTVEDAGRDVRVRVMLAADGAEAELRSTLERELAFAAHHAIHHHAMIAAIASELGIDAPPSFGKAPSTIHHEQTKR